MVSAGDAEAGVVDEVEVGPKRDQGWVAGLKEEWGTDKKTVGSEGRKTGRGRDILGFNSPMMRAGVYVPVDVQHHMVK